MKNLTFVFCALSTLLFGQERDFEIAASSAEQVADLAQDDSSLIGGAVSPLSGQISLRKTDLIAKGAESIPLHRIYIPLSLSPPFLNPDKWQSFCQQRDYHLSLQTQYRGWVMFPHCFIKVSGREIRLTDSNGTTLDFAFSNGKATLLTPPFGISNASGENCGGHYDPRNTRVAVEGDLIVVLAPDGTKRLYEKVNALFYRLKQETLPSGKILRYSYKGPFVLSRVESLDPQERFVYATLDIEGSLAVDEKYSIKTSSGDAALYQGHKPQRSGKGKNKHEKSAYQLTFPPVLDAASTCNYRLETIGYSDDFALNFYVGKDTTFQCTCKPCNGLLRIETLSFPVGEKDSFSALYHMDYNPPVAGQKEGTTTVTRSDGVKTIYRYSKNLLLESVQWFGLDGKLSKQKNLHWDENQRLQEIVWKHGSGELYYSKSFEFDRFGNPKIETFTGDLTGDGTKQTKTIHRKYSDDGFHRLLREEEEGKATLWNYLAGTNLPLAKYTLDKDKMVLREFWDYDDCHNLIAHIVDDGSAEDKEALADVTQRTITLYHLRQEAPFLHLPEWVEKLYWNGAQEVLLQKTHLGYDKRGNVSEETIYGAKGQRAYTISREFDEQGNILSETNPIGQKNKSDYDAKGRPKRLLNFSHRLETKNTYDTQGRLRKVEEIADDGVTHKTLYDYDSFDRCIKKTDFLGNVTTYLPDPITGKIVTTEGPKIASLDQGMVRVIAKSSYDPFGRKLSSTDADQNTTTYRYNAYGSPVEIIYADHSKETFLYDKKGALASHTNPIGLTIQTERDIFDRPLKKEYLAEGKPLAHESFTYSTFQLQIHTDKEKHLTTYSYDGAGRKTSEARAGRTTTFGYDSLGRLSSINYSDLYSVLYERDHLGRIYQKRKTNPLGQVLWREEYAFDSDGNQNKKTTYPNNQAATETFDFDAFGRLVEHTDALGYATTLSYDEQKILTKTTTDPNGISTVVQYDPYDREILKQIGSDHLETKVYDPAGSLLQIQEEKTLTRYSYDSRNRVRTLTRGADTPDTRTTAYRYIPTGQIDTKTLSDGVVLKYTYTPFGMPLTLTSSDGTIKQTFTHDLNNDLRFAKDSDHTVQREIDPFGNILQETIDGRLSLSKTYDDVGRLETITFDDHSSIVYTYDSLYLKAVTRFSRTHTPLYTHLYESYDLSGHPTQEQLLGELGTIERNYEPTGRLASLQSPFFAQSINYEPNGRIRSISGEGSYTYDDLDQLKSESTCTYSYDLHRNRTQKNDETTAYNLLDEINTPQIHYDWRGNIIQNGEWTYTYDALNRLTTAETTEEHILFQYDALNRRLSKTSKNLTELYLYHAAAELASFHPNHTLKDLKVPGLSHPIAIELESNAFIPLLDYRGNIRRLVALTTEQIADAYDYTAFGEPLTHALSSNPWRYSAKRYDSELGLYYFGQRYYDPLLARWLTLDPAGFVNGTNLYAYALNNPLNLLDPDGTFAIPLFTWAIGGAVCPFAIGAAVAIGVGYMACWGVQKMIDQGSLQKDSPAYTLTTGVIGGLAGSMIQTQPGTFSGNYPGPYISSTGYDFTFLDRKKEGSVDPNPKYPEILEKDPEWKETTRPGQKENDHREFENTKTGEKIRFDKGDPAKPGHGKYDHHHHLKPSSEGDYHYLDGKGNIVPRGSDPSHLYNPENKWWDK
ncbi:MAG: RHS repeat-associated core domain-containing protein [Verrucomicrobiota bacterium]|nr:RHS repeat-associated core domain-containing protein [Verrucomicrobiota bacterium]